MALWWEPPSSADVRGTPQVGAGMCFPPAAAEQDLSQGAPLCPGQCRAASQPFPAACLHTTVQLSSRLPLLLRLFLGRWSTGMRKSWHLSQGGPALASSEWFSWPLTWQACDMLQQDMGTPTAVSAF